MCQVAVSVFVYLAGVSRNEINVCCKDTKSTKKKNHYLLCKSFFVLLTLCSLCLCGTIQFKMSLIQSLYFIALLPHKQLAERITGIKSDFARNYGAFKALKVLPHITLQNPVMRSPDAEVEIHLRLQEFFEKYPPFEVELNGFSCFDNAKSKVIFVDVVKNEPLNLMHKELVSFLQSELKFTPRESPYAFHPHITIAYRDLTSETFYKAWDYYKSQPFKGNFKVHTAYLLKHDYRQWQVLSMFPLKANK